MSSPIALRAAALALRELRTEHGLAVFRDAVSRLSPDDARAVLRTWQLTARAAQLRPEDAKAIWVILAGRGFGKTRAGSEHDLDLHEIKGPFEGALISKTMTDLERDVIGGRAGLLACAARRGIPTKYVANKRVEIAGPRGTTILHVFTAEQDEFGRGPNISYFRADEIAAWRPSAFVTFQESFLPSWRIPFNDGSRMLATITTSPKPNAITRWLVRSDEMRNVVTVTGGKSEENRNIVLNEAALAIRGSRRWQQEYEGVLLDSAALVDVGTIARNRVDRIPTLTRIVIGVDPGVRKSENADATGIVVVGIGTEFPQHGYVLADYTIQGASGIDWARIVVAAGLEWGTLARCPVSVVAETNNGGDLILDNIRTAMNERGGEALAFSLESVFATKSKRARAEAVAPLYEVGRVHHVNALPALESEWVSWVEGAASPNRLDAVVHALSHGLLQGEHLPVWSEFEC